MEPEPSKSPPPPLADAQAPTLLPSVFPNESTVMFGGIEGHEGEKMHEMFLSAPRGIPAQRNTLSGDYSFEDEQVDQDVHDSEDDQSPQFDPFFTVVEDSATGEQHHPHVHYLFSDDEPDVMTNVLLHTLTNKNSTVSSESSGGQETQVENDNAHERYILIDMGIDGRIVSSARSLSPDWQVLGTQLSAAPTFNDSPGQGEASLMLRIEGREMPNQEDERDPPTKQSSKEVADDELLSSMDRLVEQFHDEMDALKRLAFSDSGLDTTDEVED